MQGLEVVDLREERSRTAQRILRACRETGFFYVVGHEVEDSLISELDRVAREFFSRPLDEKMSIRMARGGRAWRGFFPLGGELTSGEPDQKEGLYFGAELDDADARVRAGIPLHGPNLFPDDMPELRVAVLRYLEALTRLGHRLMEAVAESLDLAPSYFHDRYTRDPFVLFRIFHYPPLESPSLWSVGEHTDYGLLTIVRQDDCGGLEVRSPGAQGAQGAQARWIEAPPLEGSFVCNLGDMLERMTGGFYRSTPHRVRNRSGRSRLSFPFFFDPAFDAEVHPIRPGVSVVDDTEERWDQASVHELRGTYGEYLLKKVSKVFPELHREVI